MVTHPGDYRNGVPEDLFSVRKIYVKGHFFLS